MAASATDYFSKAYQRLSTTLSADKLSGATSMTLSSVTNWPTTTGIKACVYTLDSNGDISTSTFCVYRGTISGSTINNLTLVEGTDQLHSAGAIVSLLFTATHWNDAMTGLAVSHNQDGTMISSLPLTTPKITTSINDANGNEVIQTPATASAVNEITVTNAATTNFPRISATGGDTNIDLLISAKGTGSSRFAGIHDGWVAADETLTYASATTFTCSAALAATLQVGDKIKLTQTTAKYFYVTGISGTTITINGGTDYSLANAAITLPFYSKETSPVGFPQVFSYTPTFTNLSGGTLNYCRFMVIGRKVHVSFKYTLAGAGMGSAPTATLPITASADTSGSEDGATFSGSVSLIDAATAYWPGFVMQRSTTVVGFRYIAGTGLLAITSTAPFTWGNTDFIEANFSYDI